MTDPADPSPGPRSRLFRLGRGTALVAIGLVWIGQGVGWIKGSFMTGSAFWAVVGAACFLAGAWTLARLRA